MFKPFKAFIVDDEPPARRLLKELLLEHHDLIHVEGHADNGASAITLINDTKPNVVFLDIQLPDMLGFDVLRALNYKPLVVFTTAYDAYAIKAFDSLSIDYLLKPLRQERVSKALDKLRHFAGINEGRAVWDNMDSLTNNLRDRKEMTTLSIKKGTKFTLVQLADIAYFEAYDKYTFVHTTDGKKLFCDDMLATLEEKIPAYFVRVQKSYIVNRQKTAEVHKYSNNRFTLVLNDNDFTRIVTGPSYVEIVKEAFSV